MSIMRQFNDKITETQVCTLDELWRSTYAKGGVVVFHATINVGGIRRTYRLTADSARSDRSQCPKHGILSQQHVHLFRDLRTEKRSG